MVFFSFHHIGSVWEQGHFSTVVFFLWQWDNMFPACFSSRPLPKIRCRTVCLRGWEVWGFCVEEQQKRNRKSEEQRGVTAGGGVCVRAAASSPLLPCYSSSSLCFLPLAGPWPFLREPFWGRRRCPRSCSVHGTPPCPSSLSRSESERMRAEEVGAGTGFRRAGRERNSMTSKSLSKQVDSFYLEL